MKRTVNGVIDYESASGTYQMQLDNGRVSPPYHSESHAESWLHGYKEGLSDAQETFWYQRVADRIGVETEDDGKTWHIIVANHDRVGVASKDDQGEISINLWDAEVVLSVSELARLLVTLKEVFNAR